MSLLLALPAVLLVWLLCYGPPDLGSRDPVSPRTNLGQHEPWLPDASLREAALPDPADSDISSRDGRPEGLDV